MNQGNLSNLKHYFNILKIALPLHRFHTINKCEFVIPCLSFHMVNKSFISKSGNFYNNFHKNTGQV